MKITLISPFRTLLNIDTDRAFAAADKFAGILNEAAEAASKLGKAHYVSHRSAPPQRPFTKYTHLDQMFTTWFTEPLSRATLSKDIIQKMENYAEQKMDRNLCATQKPTTVSVDIHDNTLAIMTLELVFDNTLITQQFETPSDFETYLTNYAAACARHAEDHILQPYIEALCKSVEDAKDWKSAKYILRKPKEFLAFNDLEDHDFPIWNHTDEPSLWTHRVFHMSDMNAKELSKLKPVLRDTTIPKDEKYAMKSGTSYIYNQDIAPQLIPLNAASQYFYCMVEALNLSQKRLMRDIVDRDRGVNIAQAYSRFDRQENMLSEMENELLDFRTLLQGDGRKMFEDIQEAFRTEELVEAMKYRSNLLRNKLDRAAKRRSLLQQKLLTFILVLVSSIQVIGLVISIFGYVNSVEEDDQIVGISDLVNRIPFDLAMSVLILFLVLVALFWAIRSERQARLRD